MRHWLHRTVSSWALLAAVCLFSGVSAAAQSQNQSQKETSGNQLMQADFDELPTYVRSNSLTLHSEERKFTYSGNVEVKHGDLIINSLEMDGYYDENNQILKLIAKGNVVITRGEDIRATSERAVYEKETETITLTESPELQQQDSVLTADLITIFLKEDRSTAEGSVRVKLVEEKEEGSPDSKKKSRTGGKMRL